MPVKTSLKSRILDEKDRKILNILTLNVRESLTNIAKKVNLSIDSVNNRIREMQRKKIFTMGVFIEPKNIGYPLICDCKIKLQNMTEKEEKAFVEYLKNHKYVVDLLSILGDFDYTCVIVAKTTAELEKIQKTIRQKYSNLIADWRSMLILETHKFEDYYDLIAE